MTISKNTVLTLTKFYNIDFFERKQPADVYVKIRQDSGVQLVVIVIKEQEEQERGGDEQ